MVIIEGLSPEVVLQDGRILTDPGLTEGAPVKGIGGIRTSIEFVSILAPHSTIPDPLNLISRYNLYSTMSQHHDHSRHCTISQNSCPILHCTNILPHRTITTPQDHYIPYPHVISIRNSNANHVKLWRGSVVVLCFDKSIIASHHSFFDTHHI